MKKLILVLLTVIMTLSMAACSNNNYETTVEENITETEEKKWVETHEDVYWTDYEGQEEYLKYSADYSHDENGLIVSATVKEYNDDGTLYDNYLSENTYDTNGNLIKSTITYQTHTEDNETNIYEYDSNNRQTKHIYEYADGTSKINVYEYTDDSHYMFTRYSNEINDNNILYTRTFEKTFDENGNVSKKTWADSDDGSNVEVNYVYDENGNEIMATYTSDGEVYMTYETSYDENGNIIESYEVYTLDDAYETERCITTYIEIQ